MSDAEVGVVGLGAIGAMTLWRLAARGRSAVGFEQFTVPHAHGGYGGDTRLFRLAYREGARYHPLLIAARSLWRELNAASGRAVFTACGALSLGPEASAYITGLLAEARTPVTRMSAAEVRERYPVFRMADSEAGVFDPGGGMLRSDLAVREAVRLAAAGGAAVRDRTPVTSVRPSGDGVEVVAGGRVWRFARVVVTTGAWSPACGLPLTVKRVQLGWHLADDPAVTAPERMPVFIHDDDRRHLYGTPSTDGVTVKIAGTPSAHTVDGPAAARRPPEAGEPAARGELVREWLAGVGPEPVRVEAFPDLYTPDGAPVVGPDPRSPRITRAYGFSGRGFKYAPAMGDLLAAPDGEVPGFMSPDRFG